MRPRDPAKAAVPEAWLAEFVGAFGPLVHGVDLSMAEIWGRMLSARSARVVDALLAATASVHGLVLVTLPKPAPPRVRHVLTWTGHWSSPRLDARTRAGQHAGCRGAADAPAGGGE